MEKAILSNRIYFKPRDTEHLKELINTLTYRIETKSGQKTRFKNIEIIKNYKILPGGIISVPQGRVDLIPEGYNLIDKRVLNPVPFPNPTSSLREGQQIVYDDLEDSCVINALVGWGKTRTALHIARKLGQKTLVVTHTAMLRDQWCDEIRSLYNMEPGIIGSGKFDIEDHAIVVGNVQTVTKLVPQLNKEFGTVILDECLDYETQIDTLEFGKKKIGVIVNQEIPCHVLSMNTETQKVEYKKVLRYFKNQQETCIKLTHSGGGSIKCTSNHTLFTYIDGNIEKVSAEYLEKGDYLLQSTKGHKSTHLINTCWKPILLGLILGDGHLQLDNTSSNSVRIKVTHGEDQKRYLEWKAFNILDTTNIQEGTSGYNSERKVYSITSKSFTDVDNWREALYADGSKKRVPKRISKQLTKESWAIMYQDDGSSSQSSDSITFSFCELDVDSIANLQESLADVFNITDSIRYSCNKGFQYLRLNKHSTIKFKNSIADLVHPCLKYKLNRLDSTLTQFNFTLPSVPLFNASFCLRTILDVQSSTMTYGNRYNIEVEDNHTYFANGILVSNCHHVPATTFSNVIDNMYSRYRLGLSGTIKRTDGKQVVFADYFGPKLYQPPQSHTLDPVVRIVQTGIHLPPGQAWAQKINTLLYDEDYQQFVAAMAITQIRKGHSVLVVADRVEFLNKIKEYVGETCILITGDTEYEERKALIAQVESGQKMCIAGSRQIFSEGISVNCLSCVILAVPTSNPISLEQIIGRIMRLHPGKLDPVVLDMNFSSAAERRQNGARLAFYASKGWEVETL